MMDRSEFVRQVSDLYAHLYDLVYLRTHRLADLLLSEAAAPGVEKGWRLHDLLLSVIQQLDPGPRAPPYSREWRRYRLMLSRFQNGQDPGAVMHEIAVSKRQYYREQEAALEAVAELLWEQYTRRETAPPPAEEWPEPNPIGSLRLEAARLALIGYFVERAAQARLRVLAAASAGVLSVTVSIDPPAALRSATPGEVAERLAAFEEMADLAGARLTVLQDEGAVIGFGVGLPLEAQRAVLVVDDNEDVLELCRRYLAPHGYDVITATSAEEGIELATQLQPFAITLDLMLPGQDGWDALQALLNRPETQRIPVIICSVLKQRELALALGATAFLEKPVTEQGLLSALRTLEAV